jgi:hypothetical protein
MPVTWKPYSKTGNQCFGPTEIQRHLKKAHIMRQELQTMIQFQAKRPPLASCKETFNTDLHNSYMKIALTKTSIIIRHQALPRKSN